MDAAMQGEIDQNTLDIDSMKVSLPIQLILIHTIHYVLL